MKRTPLEASSSARSPTAPEGGSTLKRTTGLAALAVITVAGFAPATALSPQRALASAAVRAPATANAPGGIQL
jgi:hypothetical protein